MRRLGQWILSFMKSQAQEEGVLLLFPEEDNTRLPPPPPTPPHPPGIKTKKEKTTDQTGSLDDGLATKTTAGRLRDANATSAGSVSHA